MKTTTNQNAKITHGKPISQLVLATHLIRLLSLVVFFVSMVASANGQCLFDSLQNHTPDTMDMTGMSAPPGYAPPPCDNQDNYAPSITAHTPTKIIKVRFHFLRDASGNGNFSNAEAIQFSNDLLNLTGFGANYMLRNLQAMNLPIGNSTPLISDAKIQYELTPLADDPSDPDEDGICFHNSSDHYYYARNFNDNSIYPPGTATGNLYTRYDGFGDQSGQVVNVYFVQNHPAYVDEVIAGNAIMSNWGWADYGDNDVIIIGAYERFKNLDNNTSQGPYPGTDFTGWYYQFALSTYAKTLNHEMGHLFGLNHSWSSLDCGFTYKNCFDTPFHSNLHNSQTTPKTHSNNVMDYNADQNAITPCQLGLMHYNLMHRPWYYYSKLKRDFWQRNAADDITVSNGEVVLWNSSKILKGNVFVENGGVLTIKCYVGMPTDAKIIVKRGGKLIVDNGFITSNCCNTWQGIEVWGDPHSAQSAPYTNHGIVEIKNGATIENAYNGVYAGDWNSIHDNGGIVRVNNASFINCRSGINIPAYGSISGFQNMSYVINSEFNCTMGNWGDQLTVFHGVLNHIALVETYGVRIQNCKFKNEAPAGTFSDNFRGRGIQAVNASFLLDGEYDPLVSGIPCDLPTGVKNEFEGLQMGVNTYDYAPQPGKETRIMESNYKNCLYGINIESQGVKKLYKNYLTWDAQLIVDDPSMLTGNFLQGIRSQNSGQLVLDSNAAFMQADFNYLGIKPFTITHTGAVAFNSYLYMNHTQNLSGLHPLGSGTKDIFGKTIEGHNPDLSIDCNTCEDLNYDWTVDIGSAETLKSPAGAGNKANFVKLNLHTVNALVLRLPHNFNFHSSHDVPLGFEKAGPPTDIARFIPNASDQTACISTDPCAIRQNGLTIPGSEYDGGGGGSGGSGEMVLPIKDLSDLGYENLMKEDFIANTNIIITLSQGDKESRNHADLLQVLTRLKQDNKNLAQLDASQLATLMGMACNGSKAGNHAKVLLESFTEHNFDCRNKHIEIEADARSKHFDKVKPMLNAMNLKVQPNPAQDKVWIQFTLNTPNGILTISDTKGILMAKYAVSKEHKNIQVDVSAWQSGFYFITLLNDKGEQISQKLIVMP